MKIRMKIYIAGTRDGVAWPSAGGVVELPDHEAMRLCANGRAEPVEDRDGDVEKAVAPEPEKRRPGRPRKSESAD
jgi:hypothetical protein